MEDSKISYHAYIIGTTHLSDVKVTKELEDAIKNSTDRIIDSPSQSNLLTAKNILYEPIAIIGLLIYDAICIMAFKILHTSDTTSMNKLIKRINPTIKSHYNDVPVNELIGVFHKVYNYPIQIVIVVVPILIYGYAVPYIGVISFIILCLFYFAYFVLMTLDYRNKTAAQNTLKLIKENGRVLIQYGSLHRTGIKKYLEDNGIDVLNIELKENTYS